MLLVGTSGWQYRHWRGLFYPPDVAQARWLEHYAAHFATVEVNNAFYRLPEAATFADWAGRVPPDFVVGVKASRYLTHVKRLREPAEPVHRLMERACHLGPKLGPILLQLPGNFRLDVASLDETLTAFPPRVRVAFEPRHDSWFCDATAEVLERHGAALCLADGPGHRRGPYWRTTDWGYLRFHAGRARPSPCYGRQALATWAERAADLWGPAADVYAYFNNDPCGCAVRDARWFAQAARKAGLHATRVPTARQAPLCAQPA